jgi:hypothetical protein
MPWTLLRLTTDLVADGAWHGLARESTSAPASDRASDSGATIFIPVGGAGQEGIARVFDDTKIAVVAAWCTTGGSPIAGEGTALILEPVQIVSLPHPVAQGQRSERLIVGAAVDATAAVGTWAPVYLDAGPASWASVRVSGADATGVAGAARVAIWVWTR